MMAKVLRVGAAVLFVAVVVALLNNWGMTRRFVTPPTPSF